MVGLEEVKFEIVEDESYLLQILDVLLVGSEVDDEFLEVVLWCDFLKIKEIDV